MNTFIVKRTVHPEDGVKGLATGIVYLWYEVGRCAPAWGSRDCAQRYQFEQAKQVLDRLVQTGLDVSIEEIKEDKIA